MGFLNASEFIKIGWLVVEILVIEFQKVREDGVRHHQNLTDERCHFATKIYSKTQEIIRAYCLAIVDLLFYLFN